jgi:hypothetical protein
MALCFDLITRAHILDGHNKEARFLDSRQPSEAN